MSERDIQFYQREQPQTPDFLRTDLLETVRDFTDPQHDTRTLFKDIYRFGEESFPRATTGLVIGRFQPLHYGHIYNWQMALATSEQILIAIGSVNKQDSDNPFTAKERETMVRDALDKYRIGDRVAGIVQLEDIDGNDNKWLQETLKITGRVDAVVGNNEWVNGIFENSGLRALRPPLLERGIYEGKKYRLQLRQEGKLN